MSTAARVPETATLTGDDARRTVRATGRLTLLRDAFLRMRVADGFSHARSLAFVISLLLLEGIIGLVGLASLLGDASIGRGITRTFRAAAPGPAGDVLTDAVQQARAAGAANQWLGLLFGFVGAIVTGATLMGQLERGLNRIYGIEQDRPTLQKYGRATVLALTAGVFAAIAFGALAFGDAINDAIERDATRSIWVVARWPVAFLLVTAAVGLVFRVAPRRRQPAWSWLAVGAAVAVILWFGVTAGLGLLFGVSNSFSATYGGLAGMVALLLWALLSSMAVFYGAAVAAQLEAVRAHAHAPQDREKAEHSAPDVEAPPLLHTFDADDGSLLERR